MKRIFLLTIILFCLALSATAQDEDTRRVISDYYSPCKAGTEAEIFSWHSYTQDGKGEVDMSRQAFHFFCENREIYAVHGGEVWGSTQRWGGLILVDDHENDVCIVYLGMESVEVSRGDIIEVGQYLGQYLYRPHITALDADCEEANWYDWNARDFETPIIFLEIGYVIAPDLQDYQSIPFVSQNPSIETARLIHTEFYSPRPEIEMTDLNPNYIAMLPQECENPCCHCCSCD